MSRSRNLVIILILSVFIFSCTQGQNDSGSDENVPPPKDLRKFSESFQYLFTRGKNGPVATYRNYINQMDATVQGKGQCAGTQESDAFYLYGTGNTEPTKCPSMFVDNVSLYNIDNPAYPEKREDTSYPFSLIGNPSFSIGDTYVADNTGYYIFTVIDKTGIPSITGRSYTGCGNDLSVDLIQQGPNLCGPTCLEMYLKYILNKDISQTDIKDLLTNFPLTTIGSGSTPTETRFWSSPINAKGSDIAYQDGYVDLNGQIYGTYGEYLFEAAAYYLDQNDKTGYVVRSIQYMTIGDIEYFIDNNTPVLVCVWIDGEYNITFDNKKYTDRKSVV